MSYFDLKDSDRALLVYVDDGLFMTSLVFFSWAEQSI